MDKPVKHGKIHKADDLLLAGIVAMDKTAIIEIQHDMSRGNKEHRAIVKTPDDTSNGCGEERTRTSEWVESRWQALQIAFAYCTKRGMRVGYVEF